MRRGKLRRILEEKRHNFSLVLLPFNVSGAIFGECLGQGSWQGLQRIGPMREELITHHEVNLESWVGEQVVVVVK